MRQAALVVVHVAEDVPSSCERPVRQHEVRPLWVAATLEAQRDLCPHVPDARIDKEFAGTRHGAGRLEKIAGAYSRALRHFFNQGPPKVLERDAAASVTLEEAVVGGVTLADISHPICETDIRRVDAVLPRMAADGLWAENGVRGGNTGKSAARKGDEKRQSPRQKNARCTAK